MREIDTIIIHCSASEYGNAALFRKWHVEENGWDDIGYHFVIGNAYPTYESHRDNKPVFELDGNPEYGRKVEIQGAHCKEYNAKSIGICLVGQKNFTSKQFEALIGVIKLIKARFPTIKSIYGHYEFNPYKTCPNIDMGHLRDLLFAHEQRFENLTGLWR